MSHALDQLRLQTAIVRCSNSAPGSNVQSPSRKERRVRGKLLVGVNQPGHQVVSFGAYPGNVQGGVMPQLLADLQVDFLNG